MHHAKTWWPENCEKVYENHNNIYGIDRSIDGGDKFEGKSKVSDGGLDGKDQGIVCLLNGDHFKNLLGDSVNMHYWT